MLRETAGGATACCGVTDCCGAPDLCADSTAGEAIPDAVSAFSAIVDVRDVPLCSFRTTTVPIAITNTAAAARQYIQFLVVALRATIPLPASPFPRPSGTTPAGTLSSAVRIRDDAAMNPRASATAAAH
jgi:hypothetical protein